MDPLVVVPASGLPALVATFNASGAFRAVVWFFFLLQGFFTVGLLLRLPLTRYLLLLYLGANFFLFSLVVWVFIYIAFAWRARTLDILVMMTFIAHLLQSFLGVHLPVSPRCGSVLSVAADIESPRFCFDVRTGRLEIEYCTQCRWLLRAAWMAQELLTTFETELAEVALIPGTGGILEVRLDGVTIFSRKEQGRFPESKELKQLVRDRIAPEKDLGHSDSR